MPAQADIAAEVRHACPIQPREIQQSPGDEGG